MRITASILLAPLALAACSPSADTDAPPAGDAAPVAQPAAPDGAGAPVILVPQELAAADIEQAALSGELACAFQPSAGGETLFLGRGDVLAGAGAVGVVKLAGGVERLAMEGSGGFDAMRKGARFTGQGLSLAIEPTGGAADGAIAPEERANAESPAHPARMTLRSGGSELAIDGVYQCGP